MSNFIEVGRSRFYEIFAYDRYQSQLQKSIYEWTSCPWYDVIDRTTNEIVGRYSDGSWENTFEVLIELASKEDIIAHYQKILERKDWDIDSLKIQNKNLLNFRNASPEKRAEIEKQAKIDKERRKNSPGLMNFMEDSSIISYPSREFNVDSIINQLKILDDKNT